jgi:competence protein ComGC
MQWRNVFCTVHCQFKWRVFPLPNFEKQWVKKPSHYNHLYVPAKRHVLFPTGFIFVAKFAVPQLNSLPLSVRSPYGLLLQKQENCYKNRKIATKTGELLQNQENCTKTGELLQEQENCYKNRRIATKSGELLQKTGELLRRLCIVVVT